jgi:urate oxidase
MAGKLTFACYGKSDVRVTKVIRHTDRHDLIEMSVDVQLQGRFKQTYLTGDNRKVVATDSMKNTVYVFARKHRFAAIESFALALAGHFVRTYRQVTFANVRIRQSRWKRINVKGKAHPHAFISGGAEVRTCSACYPDRERILFGGLADLLVLKTTASGFSDFVRDEYTTLKDTDDRVFATTIEAAWRYSKSGMDFNKAFDLVREALIETFATHKSLSVQQTLHEMGQAALRRCKSIRDIRITLPNKHRILANLQPFGLDNPNEVFIWTDAPYGNIVGHIERS